MRKTALALGLVLTMGGLRVAPAAADPCDKLQPLPPQDTDRSATGKLDAAVDGWFAKLAKVGGGAEGTYRDVSRNVLPQFPDADRLYVWDRVIFLKCQLIMDARDLSTRDKLAAVDQLANQFDQRPPPAPSYGAVNNSGSNSTIIQGNGNTVNGR
ncbi:MAG: hypothetical protein JOY70_08075 [Acidisphaera sp.]|nr:hypothetical protein [Acidisphaera sp.]